MKPLIEIHTTETKQETTKSVYVLGCCVYSSKCDYEYERERGQIGFVQFERCAPTDEGDNEWLTEMKK